MAYRTDRAATGLRLTRTAAGADSQPSSLKALNLRSWQCRSPQLEEPGSVNRVTPAGHAELAVEGPLVGLDRVHRQIEIARDLRGRQGAGEVAQYGALPLGEWVDRLVSGLGGGRRHVGHPLEHVEREPRYGAACSIRRSSRGRSGPDSVRKGRRKDQGMAAVKASSRWSVA